MIQSLTIGQLRKALAIREQIDEWKQELASIESGGQSQKRGMSAEGRARIAAAQRARWAKAKGGASDAKSARKGRRKMSAAGRARISVAAKARWAKFRAARKVKR